MTSKIPTGFRLEQERLLKLREIATKEHRSLNNLLEVIVEDFLKHYEQGEK